MDDAVEVDPFQLLLLRGADVFQVAALQFGRVDAEVDDPPLDLGATSRKSSAITVPVALIVAVTSPRLTVSVR